MYVSSRYNNCVVVFDRYKTISTKHHEHLRRNFVPQSSSVAIEMDNEIPYQLDRYLSLEENKVELIKFLSRYMEQRGVRVVNCRGDANAEIVRVAIRSCQESSDAVAVVVVVVV